MVLLNGAVKKTTAPGSFYFLCQEEENDSYLGRQISVNKLFQIKLSRIIESNLTITLISLIKKSVLPLIPYVCLVFLNSKKRSLH